MTQDKIFVDAHYWIALLSKKDQWHDMAVSARERIEQLRLVTSEMVLTEVLDAFANGGEYLRAAASLMVDVVLSDENTEVVPQTSEMFSNAFSLYKKRPEQEWQLTDCASMLIMNSMALKMC